MRRRTVRVKKLSKEFWWQIAHLEEDIDAETLQSFMEMWEVRLPLSECRKIIAHRKKTTERTMKLIEKCAGNAARSLEKMARKIIDART